MRCENCRWFDASTQQALAQPDTTGLCRFEFPIPDKRDGTARWPFVQHTDWCRRFKQHPVPDDGTIPF